ncbi:MAG: hypothetical protein FJX76_11610 [Armatimonadetes bacterium]|nr:hypothetical protein [Armatimonadota bacterium]
MDAGFIPMSSPDFGYRYPPSVEPSVRTPDMLDADEWSEFSELVIESWAQEAGLEFADMLGMLSAHAQGHHARDNGEETRERRRRTARIHRGYGRVADAPTLWMAVALLPSPLARVIGGLPPVPRG